jgi:hypothetical protein
MCLHGLSFSLRPTDTAEANTQQAFVDILDNDVIKPLVTFKVSEYDLVWAEISVLIIGRSDRKLKMRQESGLREISSIPPRSMPIIQRTQFRSSNRHISRNITLGNMFTLLVGLLETCSEHSKQHHRFPVQLNDLLEPEPCEDDFRSASGLLNTFRLRRAENLEDGYDVSDNICSDIDPTSSIPNAVSSRTRFRTNCQECNRQIY